MIAVLRPTQQIRAARRLIESLPGVELLTDLSWFEVVQAWGMLCRISIDSINCELVPPETEWWVTLQRGYPYGKIVFYPAKVNGLTSTFPHQQYNGREHPSAPWRTGDICVRSPVFTFGKLALDPDPLGHPNRLAWYFGRAIEWLKTAADGNLLAKGDPFELPAFPLGTNSQYTVAHGESAETYCRWKTAQHRYGTAEIIAVGQPDNHLVAVRRFFDHRGQELLTYDWGRVVASSKKLMQPAVWLYCQTLPIIKPYHAIGSWEDLFKYLRTEGCEDSFKGALDLIRDGETHLLLLGFPIPARIGDEPQQLHWQPIRLPVISHGTQFANGFRPNGLGYWMRDKAKSFPSKGQPNWQTSENWSREETSVRGRINEAISGRSSLIIGVGAVGSVVSELLVRSGAGPLVVCDGDDVHHGNLCRHLLRLDDIGRNKADAVAIRLSSANAHADVRSIANHFPPKDESDVAMIEGCDFVFDCTGDDGILQELARHEWGREKFFCSISLSYKAKRVYVFTAWSFTFPIAEFQSQMPPCSKKDLDEFSGEELVQAGVGCWHPAFPARVDDIWMLAAAAVRRMEEAVVAKENQPRLVVFEQIDDGGVFQGIKRS